MNFEQRETLIHENFIRKMTTMYLPPNNVKQSDASKETLWRGTTQGNQPAIEQRHTQCRGVQ